MHWLADECVAAPLVASLRSLRHDVLYVAESASGLRDTDVIELASIEGRLLLTEDKDFGDLVFRRERKVPGVVLIRIGPDTPRIEDDATGCSDRKIWRRPFGPLPGDRGRPFPRPSIVEFDVVHRGRIRDNHAASRSLGPLPEARVGGAKLSANRLSLDIGVPSGRVTDVLDGRRAITADTAVRLGLYFGNSAQFWLDLQSHTTSVRSSGRRAPSLRST